MPLGAKLVVRVGCFVQGVKMIPPEEGCYDILWAAAGDKEGVVSGELCEPVGVLSQSDE